MGVGPPGRTGSDQLNAVRAFVADRPVHREVVIIACSRGAGGIGAQPEFDDARVFPVTCSGNLHTSTVEFLVRSGAAGVLIVSCPPRDCWNREGPLWLEQRLYHDREAELKPRVDRRRIRLVFAAEQERSVVGAALAAFRADVAPLDAVAAEASPDVEQDCKTPAPSVAEARG
jgi:coenzyme F420-reducing hydrogenase delta subunit